MGRSNAKHKESHKSVVAASAEGLDDFFTVSNSGDTTSHKKKDVVEVAPPDSLILTVKEACKKLGIRKKILYLRISEGVYKTFAGRDGDIRVVLPANAKVEEPVIYQSNRPVESEPAVEKVSQPTPDPELAAVVEKLFAQMSAASMRIGYLESQLEQYSEQTKLLPDLRSHITQSIAIKQENDQLRQRLSDLESELVLAQRPPLTRAVQWLTPHIKWWFAAREPHANLKT